MSIFKLLKARLIGTEPEESNRAQPNLPNTASVAQAVDDTGCGVPRLALDSPIKMLDSTASIAGTPIDIEPRNSRSAEGKQADYSLVRHLTAAHNASPAPRREARQIHGQVHAIPPELRLWYASNGLLRLTNAQAKIKLNLLLYIHENHIHFGVRPATPEQLSEMQGSNDFADDPTTTVSIR